MKATTALIVTGVAAMGAAFAQGNLINATSTTCTDNVRDNITYSWNQSTGIGSIAVKSGVTFCQPVYITKAAWNLTTANVFPQTLASKEVVKITGSGVYDVSIPAKCRQQTDLYYGYGTEATLPAKLNNAYDDSSIEFFSKIGGKTPTWSLNTKECVAPTPTPTPTPEPTPTPKPVEPKEETPVIVDVTPTAPTYKDECEAKKDTYTIPAKTGVTYVVNGKVTKAGTYPRTDAKVEITAKAKDGYKLTGTTSWAFTFTDEPCAAAPAPKQETPAPTVETPSKNETKAPATPKATTPAAELPHTGAGILGAFGAVLLSAGTYAAVLGRNKR